MSRFGRPIHKAVTSLAALAIGFQSVIVEAQQAQVRNRTPDGAIPQLQNRLKDVERELAEIRRTQELLIEMVARVNQAPSTPPAAKEQEQAASKVESDIVALEQAIQVLPVSPAQKAGVPEALDYFKVCMEEAKEVQAGRPPNGRCKRADLQAQLDKVRESIQGAYNECTSKLKAAQAGADRIRNLNVLAAEDRKEIANMASGLDAGIKECIQKASDAAKAFDQSMRSMSDMFNMAASVCYATGGNPYVCGAMLALAVLAALFEKGGGDGDGKEKGPQRGKGTNGQQSVHSDIPGLGGSLVCTHEGTEYVCREGSNVYIRFPASLREGRGSWQKLVFDSGGVVKLGEDFSFDPNADAFKVAKEITRCDEKSLTRNGKPVDGLMIVTPGSNKPLAFAWQGTWRAVAASDGNCPAARTEGK